MNTAVNDPNLVAQGASGLTNPSSASSSERQSHTVSAATETTLRNYFRGVSLTQADLSFDYQSFGRGNESLTGAVQAGRDSSGQTRIVAGVNTDAIADQAPPYGLNPGRLDGQGRATAGSLLDAVAAQEVAQKITQAVPALQGMSRERQELVGEGAMLAVLPDSFTRTLSRSSQHLVNPTEPGYAGIAQQTTDTLQRTLNSAGHTNLNAGNLLREYDTFERSNIQRFSGLPNAQDSRAPYDAAFEEFFRSKGIQNPGQFMNDLRSNMSQDFQQAGQRAITDQLSQNQNQNAPRQRSDAGEQDPQFARLFDQARNGLQAIGNDRLGVNDPKALDNAAGVMADLGVRGNYQNFGRIVPGKDDLVFGMKQDPSAHPGPYEYVTVNPKLAAEVPLAQSANNAREHTLEAQQQIAARTQEPKGIGMG